MAWLLVLAWLVHTITIVISPDRVWWIPVMTFFVIAAPALIYLWPPAKPDDTRLDRIVFATTLVDDDRDENADESERCGKSALDAIRDLLLQRGKTVSAIEPHSFYGWTMDVERHEALIQGYEESLLLIVRGHDAVALAATIAEVMTGDPRFSDVQVTTEAGLYGVANARVVRQ